MISRAFFLLTLLVMLGGATPAAAANLWKDNPLIQAQVHCRLLVLAADSKRRLDPALLDKITGSGGYESIIDERLKIIHIGMTGGLPDFGFIIGPRWQAFSRDQRRDFNRVFTGFVLRSFGISPQSVCAMKSSMTVLSESPIAYIATVSTQLMDGKQQSIPVTYRLEKHPPDRWSIMHLQIGEKELHDSYTEVLNQMIASKGFDDALHWFEHQYRPKP